MNRRGMVDLIESVLENEELRTLIEAAEPTGSIRQADLAEFLELHPLDALEIDALYRELDQRGIEVVEAEKEREPAPPQLIQQLSYETTTDALQLFLREAGRHALLTAPQEVELAKRIERGDQEDAVFGDFVAGDGPLPEDEVEVSLRSQALSQALASLPERERRVLELRYGLYDAEPKTLEEIGRRLGLTRERVRQIELDTLRRLATLRGMQAVAG